ncbi:putative phage abortive infection protein [Azospira oryzae]|uniref:putative phage abortive infection protein n=1 Tax=Azospira oryzae TaxID=146939 RepID=UPI001966780E|nr:putative phage abortive infection protein [Azospira oryzae]
MKFFKNLRVSFATLIVAFPLGIYFFHFYGQLSTNHGEWGDFGSYISGVYGTLAFVVLAYTTNITRRQFQIQNEDNIFFKLYESLQNRITNSSALVGDANHTAHQTLKAVAKKFHEELSAEAIEIARHLLCETPEEIADVHYMKIFEAIWGWRFIDSFNEKRDNFISDINGQRHFNDRWEQLKCYIGSRGEETGRLKEALRATGCVNFYKIPYSTRRQHYIAVTKRLSDEHGEFLDGYFKNICFLLEFAAKSINQATYVSFLNAQLTKYEIVILFYLAAGRNGELGSIKYLRDLGIMDSLITPDCQSLMLDFPSDEELKNELENVFK